MNDHSRIAVLTVLAVAASLAATAAEVSPRLTGALADPGAWAWRADGRLTVWVHLEPRDLAPAALAAALDTARDALPERTLRRRARVRPAGARLVDAGDLPLSPGHLASVAATGAAVRRHSRWLNAVSVAATAEQVAALAALPCVRRLELVARHRRRPPPDAPRPGAPEPAAPGDKAGSSRTNPAINYGGSLAALEQINVPAVHALGYTGAGVAIGMLDTGFLTTHEALAAVDVLASYDLLDDDPVVADEPGDPPGQHNHGTQTLSTVAGFRDNELVGPAFGAGVILAKTEDASAEYQQEEDVWVAGLEWVEQQGADIVSSSLGYSDWYDFADLDGATAVSTIAADLAAARGLLVITSAGNERGQGTGHIIAPADGDSVLAVGAVDATGAVTGFSSPGPTADGRIKPDVSALGAGNLVVSLIDDHSYTNASGTSFACPLVAGVAALLLERAPMLTPLQLGEALRETASQAGAPDNDLGWGVIDALAALRYWGATIVHDALPDSEDTGTPFSVVATITGRVPPAAGLVNLFWRGDDGPWLAQPLSPIGGDQWQATIPAQTAGSEVRYFFEVTDEAGVTVLWPRAGAGAPFAFAVGPDTTPPSLTHTPLGDQPLDLWPPLVTATASDNLGLAAVELRFCGDDGQQQGPFPLEPAGDTYSLALPVDAAAVAVGDSFRYTLTARDLAAEPNLTVSGPHGFVVVENLGRVLVLADESGAAADQPSGPDKAEPPARDGGSNADAIAAWLLAAGYAVTAMPATAAGPEDLAAHQAVVVSAGDGAAPLADPTLRATLAAFARGGGRLLLEGGEIAYDALSHPGYPELARDVLHAAGWRGDSAGAVTRVAGLAAHPLLTSPHAIPPSLALDYAGYGDQDAVLPAADALVVMDTSGYPGSAGALVHDDNLRPEAAQIVYLAFDLGALAPETARLLVENAVALLLAAEPPPTARVAGRVHRADGGDPAGVRVLTGGEVIATTDAGGHYLTAALHPGTHRLSFVRAGQATVRRELTLAEAELREGVDVELRPAVLVEASVAPFAPIPDADPEGVTSVLTIAESGPVTALAVDIEIEHPWIGDLTVRLLSPAGTPVTLHARTGGPADDIVGNWPQTLMVDGPGSLDDLLDEELAGPWRLQVTDTGAEGTGTLRRWGLQVVTTAPPTGVGRPPRATRLVGARPNPFNPRTEVVFELAAAGPVALTVHDLQGRRVRRLAAGEWPAGRHRVRWDGRDDRGRELASGVYLCRLEAGVVEVAKLTLLR